MKYEGMTFPPWPRPHTSTWHELHMLFNGDQAMHCMAIIAAAGSDNVCGICGDHEDVSDLMAWSEENTTVPEFPVRICGDCMEIQSGWGVMFRKPEPDEFL